MNTTTAQIHLRIFLLAQGGRSEIVQDREIPRGVTFSDTTVILAEDYVEGPVQVFFLPTSVKISDSERTGKGLKLCR